MFGVTAWLVSPAYAKQFLSLLEGQSSWLFRDGAPFFGTVVILTVELTQDLLISRMRVSCTITIIRQTCWKGELPVSRTRIILIVADIAPCNVASINNY